MGLIYQAVYNRIIYKDLQKIWKSCKFRNKMM